MKALILNNQVVQVGVEPFEVHQSLVWVDCPDYVEAYMYTYENGEFVAIPQPEPEPEPEEPVYPEEGVGNTEGEYIPVATFGETTETNEGQS
jgi:hypothetical protein